MKKNSKVLTFILLAALLSLAVVGIALAATTTRTGHISRPVSLQQPLVTPTETQNITFSTDQVSGTVIYTVKQVGGIAYSSVVVTPISLTTGMDIMTDKTGFSMAVGDNTTVTLTITFTDISLTLGDYSVTFEAS